MRDCRRAYKRRWCLHLLLGKRQPRSSQQVHLGVCRCSVGFKNSTVKTRLSDSCMDGVWMKILKKNRKLPKTLFQSIVWNFVTSYMLFWNVFENNGNDSIIPRGSNGLQVNHNSVREAAQLETEMSKETDTPTEVIRHLTFQMLRHDRFVDFHWSISHWLLNMNKKLRDQFLIDFSTSCLLGIILFGILKVYILYICEEIPKCVCIAARTFCSQILKISFWF